MTDDVHENQDLRLLAMWIVACNEGEMSTHDVADSLALRRDVSHPHARDVVEQLYWDGWLVTDDNTMHLYTAGSIE